MTVKKKKKRCAEHREKKKKQKKTKKKKKTERGYLSVFSTVGNVSGLCVCVCVCVSDLKAFYRYDDCGGAVNLPVREGVSE